MRRRSLTGPLMLLLIGGWFLWRNMHPEAPGWDIVAQYWPFVLIAWGVLRLVEVIVWRGDGHPSFSGGEVVLVILICMVGMSVWAAHRHGFPFAGNFNNGNFDWWGEPYDYPISAQHAAAGMTRIVFENPRGNVKVIGSDTGDVTVNGHKVIRAYTRTEADRTNGNTPVEMVPEGDHLLIRTNQDRAPDNQRISDDLEVMVPHGVAVEARGRLGDYDIADVAGDVELASDHGDVRLNRVGGNARLDIGKSALIRAVDMKGKIDVQGRGTDIELENIAGQVTIGGSYAGTLDFKNLSKPLQLEGARNTELRVEAVPGSISMDLGEFTANNVIGPMRLVTNSRDIKVEGFTQSLELDTQRGDIELHPTRLPLGTIEAHSGIGRIDLVLPGNAAFQLDATAQRGEAVNDFGPQIQRETEGHTSTLKGKVGDGPTLHVTADRGSVSVRKEGTAPTGGAIPNGKTPKHSRTPEKSNEAEVHL